MPVAITVKRSARERSRYKILSVRAFAVRWIFAAELHAGQVKKGGHNIPYISHLLGVTSLVIEAGGDEDMAIAALLHDAVEDQGGLPTLAAHSI